MGGALLWRARSEVLFWLLILRSGSSVGRVLLRIISVPISMKQT